MTLEDEFKTRVRDHLAGLRGRFQRELENLFALNDPAAATVILFEYDSPHFADDFSLMLCYLRRPGEQIARFELMRDSVVIPDMLDEDPRYEPIAPWGRASEVLADWLVEQWVSFRRLAVPAYAGHHDSGACVELATGRWISTAEIRFTG